MPEEQIEKDVAFFLDISHRKWGPGGDVLICFGIDSTDGDFWWELQTRYIETQRGG